MTDALHTALGLPGSGRLRYAAAMAHHRDGAISAAVLEVYRIASATDALDPAVLLAERGLPVPARAAQTPQTTVRALLDEADRYLATLPGPGVAEVRAALTAHRAGPLTLTMPLAPGSEVVDTHLPAALDRLQATHPALAQAIAAACPHLTWQPLTDAPPGAAALPPQAHARLIGPAAALPAPDFDLCLLLIAPHAFHHDHRDGAPRLYAPLTGPHGWRFGLTAPLVVKPAHAPVWTPAHRALSIKIGPTPFLGLHASLRR